MTLKQLEAFYWAATCHSFALAAQRANLSISSLSKRIAELESSLGQTLFDRSGHKARLTAAGTRLLPHSGALLQQAERVRQDIGSAVGLQGPCRIGVGELSALTWLPRLIVTLTQAHPALALSTHVDIGERLAHMMDRGVLDIAVIAGRAGQASLMSTPLAQARFVWCAAPALARQIACVDAEAVRRHALVLLPRGSGVTSVVDNFLHGLGAEPGRVIESNQWSAIVGLLAAGGGLGLLPEAVARALAAREVLRIVPAAAPLLPLSYAFHCRRDDVRPLVASLRVLTAEAVDFSIPAAMF